MTVSEPLQTLKLAMEHAALPWGLLGLSQLQLNFANKALQVHLQSCRLPPSLGLSLHAPLLQAAENCLASDMETTARLPACPGVWHFTPVMVEGKAAAVQCYVLPEAALPSEGPASGLEHSDRFEVFLDHLPYQVWIATPHGEVTWLNKALTQYAYNHSRRVDLREGIWIDIVHPDDLASVNAGLSRALITEKPTRYRLRIKSHGGPYHWFFATLAPVKNREGQTQYWVGANIGIDGIKQAEDQFRDQIATLRHQLKRGHQELDQAHAALAQLQKLDMVSKLSAGVAHDLNNLLFITGLHAGLLEKKLHEPEHREHVEVIHDTIKKAGRLASQLTGFSSRKPMELSAADPGQLVRDIEQLLRNAVGAEVEFRLHLAASLWPINVDRMFFENSLINLCINARDAVNGKGHISVSVENALLNHGGHPGEHVMISVSDDGVGMDESVRARIFEMFFTTKPDGKGAGLGLPMVKNFMDHAKGLIEVESAKGRGSCFRLYFPRAEPSSAAKPPVQAIAEGEQETILLIENNLDMRNAMAMVLYELGYQVATAYKPEVALRYINSGLKVDLIIATARMPGQLSAMEMHRQLKAEQVDIPMLLTTGRNSEQATDLDSSEYTVLFKPVSMPDLAQAVHDLLHRDPATTQSLHQ